MSETMKEAMLACLEEAKENGFEGYVCIILGEEVVPVMIQEVLDHGFKVDGIYHPWMRFCAITPEVGEKIRAKQRAIGNMGELHGSKTDEHTD